MVTLALAKQNSRVRHDDEDTLIQQFIDDAIANVESWSGTLLTRREVTQPFAAFCTEMPLFWGPSPDDVTVAYFDTDDAEQEIADARVVRDWLYAGEGGWPSIADNSVITVTYTSGWTEVPADLIGAVLVLVDGKISDRNGGDAYEKAERAAKAACFKYMKLIV